jgi:hemerythrin-like domain-containing protein
MSLSPTETLESEHRFIQKVVAASAILADRLAAGTEGDVDVLRGIVEFMRTYADKCHHGKEEALLFPALERRGVPMRGCPVGALIGEHKLGRTLVGALAEAIDVYSKGRAEAKDTVIKSLRGIVDLYPNHIWKEDFLLFPMTMKVLSPADLENLSVEFEKVEDNLGKDVHHHFEHFVDINRLAIIGETKWQEWMAKFCRPFTTATIRYFDHAAADEARRWIRES